MDGASEISLTLIAASALLRRAGVAGWRNTSAPFSIVISTSDWDVQTELRQHWFGNDRSQGARMCSGHLMGGQVLRMENQRGAAITSTPNDASSEGSDSNGSSVLAGGRDLSKNSNRNARKRSPTSYETGYIRA